MSDITYDTIQAEIAQAEVSADAEGARLEKKKKDFIRQQSFTGEELLTMRNAIQSGECSQSEPRLDFILEKILENRKIG